MFLRRFADCVSPEPDSPCSLLSSMMILQFLLKLLKSTDDFRFAKIVGDDPNVGFLLDGLIEQIEDRLSCLETHPRERFILFWVRRP